MHNALFSIGPFTITLLGLFSGLGILGGLWIVHREASRHHWNEDLLFTTALIGLVSAFLGARLYFALIFSPAYFFSSPMRIFALHEGGLSIQGGIIGGLIGVLAYCRIKRVSFWQTADIFAPGIILGQAIGRVGCDVFGVPASQSVWWAVPVQGQALHPVQMYESMLNYMLFLVLWRIRGKTRLNGEVFLVYIMAFAFNRFTVEFFRSNPQAFGPFTVAHAGSIVMLAAAASIFFLRRKHAGTAAVSAQQISAPVGSFAGAAAAIGALATVSVGMYYLIHLVLLR